MGITVGMIGGMTTSKGGGKGGSNNKPKKVERPQSTNNPGRSLDLTRPGTPARWGSTEGQRIGLVGESITGEKRAAGLNPSQYAEADAQIQATYEQDVANMIAKNKMEKPIIETEVNPEIRTQFENKTVDNQMIVKDLQKQNWIQKLESSQFGKTITNINDIQQSIIGGAFIGGVALLTVAIPPAGLALSGIIGADMLSNWAALDNTIGQSAIMTSRLVSDMGNSTPEQRKQSVAAAEEAYNNAKVANAKIVTSTMIDPATWPFKKLWNTSAKNSMNQIEYNLNILKNYNPNADPYSTEMKLQTYGKPKYDSQGNPL
jgi:hypothetical protein